MADVKHSPGPWKWGEERWNDCDLYDANGKVVVRHDPERIDDEVKPEDRPVLAAAPEMLALLRGFEWMDMSPLSAMPRCAACMSSKALGHAEGCRLAALLARIDGG